MNIPLNESRIARAMLEVEKVLYKEFNGKPVSEEQKIKLEQAHELLCKAMDDQLRATGRA